MVTIILYLLLLHVVNNVFDMVEHRLEAVVSVLVFILVRHLALRHVEGEESTGRLLPFTYRVCHTVLVYVVEGQVGILERVQELRNTVLSRPCW